MAQEDICVLMVEDDEILAELISDYLQNCGITVEVKSDPTTVMEYLKETAFDLIILDLTLPKMDGLFLCERISAAFDVPIIISSARDEVSDKVLGLEKGADDYLPKPYDPRELVARINAMLRRKKSSTSSSSVKEEIFGDFKIDKSKMVIYHKESALDLTVAEYGVLSFFINQRGIVLSRGTILDAVEGLSWESDERSIDVIISRLRSKLFDNPRTPTYIESIRGVGYRMKS
ncbi:response regulator transcription factor [Sulfurimonas crateris]|uniref:Response regulator transcription factor n=1 Tax=Sulfurimonas crateris TaxID=2574727 RepID=A0A4V5TM81_9BACT|nr:response regulator transcription factor [Sulfurimonas crateris]TKI69623.1 response regulator transcription factor [Sulfurimonas crateris]